jgi:hypothetical protein
MRLDRWLAAALFLSVLLPSALARAQAEAPVAPPETLETPYQDTPVAPPPPTSAPPSALPPPAPAVAPPTAPVLPHKAALPPPAAVTRPLGSVRSRRRLALLGEIGWNGLAGFGPVLTYYPNPHVGLDLGAGLSLLGWKAGVRGRYNLLDKPWTPFLGVGFNATTGFGEVTFDPEKDLDGNPNRDPVTVNLKPSYLIQTVLGVDFIHRHGFTMVGSVGYAALLNSDNIEILAGEFTKDEKRAIDIAFKGGVVISLAMGYAFE